MVCSKIIVAGFLSNFRKIICKTNMTKERKFYLTPKGLEKIKKEFKTLKQIRAIKIRGEVPRIWESEDLNPEYLSFREDLSFVETRLAELKNVLDNAELIKQPPKSKRKNINLGATVVAEIEGDKDEFTIIGTLEANPSLGKISNESPVGKALLGHKVGDEVIVSSPIKVIYKILKIKYSSL